MSEWQPIETAPKDGSVILLLAGQYVFAGCWYRDGEIRYDANGVADEIFPWLVLDPAIASGLNAYMEGKVTHWMPLPPAPGLSKEK